MQANQFTNAQGTSYGQPHKDYYSPSAVPTVPIAKQSQQTAYPPPPTSSQQYPANPPSSIPTSSNHSSSISSIPPSSISSIPPSSNPPSSNPPSSNPPSSIPTYMQQSCYQHPQLTTTSCTQQPTYTQQHLYQHPQLNNVAAYFAGPQIQCVYQNPSAGPPVTQKVPPIPSPLDQPLLPPGVKVGKKLKFKCNSSNDHPYIGGHAIYDLSGRMIYDAQISPNSKGKKHVIMDAMGREVLSATVRLTTQIELNIMTSQGPKIAVYTRGVFRSKGKHIEVDGVTYVLTTEKVGRHRIFQPKLYKWAPVGGHEVASRYGSDFVVYNTCPEALELAIVFVMALLCHSQDLHNGMP